MIRTIRVEGAELWTESGGSGPPILLGSGGPGCCDYLGPVAEMLAEHAQVIRWEQRGCGRSTSDGRYDLATTLADMEAIRCALGFDRWAVGGHSWGADLAVAYAWHHPARVDRLLALAGGLLMKDRSWSEAYRAGRDANVEPQPDYAYPPNLEVNRALNASWLEFTHRDDLWLRAAAISCPALWICAGRDIRPSWPQRQLARLVPHGRFRVIEGAQHVIWLTHAEALRAELAGWWRDCPGGK
jgi:proline iminopeptidase